jgi:hypothetical protein
MAIEEERASTGNVMRSMFFGGLGKRDRDDKQRRR